MTAAAVTAVVHLAAVVTKGQSMKQLPVWILVAAIIVAGVIIELGAL